MRWLLSLAIVAATVVGTELLAHAVHRHVMHGWGWRLHRSHHEPRTGWLEHNDWYAVIFALIAIALMMIDAGVYGPLYWIGIGMTVYGMLYFFVHDLVTHRRWPLRAASGGRVPTSGYLKRLVQAHRLHHAVRGRDGAVSFGFLYAPPVRTLKARLAQQSTVRAAAHGPAKVPVEHG